MSIFFQCPLCEDVIFDHNIQLISHLCQHFHPPSSTKLEPSPFEHINTKCPICQSEFSSPYFLAMHLDDKHMSDLHHFHCRICHEPHASLPDLIQHLNHQHGGLDMPYSCQVCSFRTSIYADMIYHIDEVHRGTRYFVCPYCLIAIELPLLSSGNALTLLNGNLASQHLLLHANKTDDDPNQTAAHFQSCRKCLLHVPSIKEHFQRDHLHLVNGIRNSFSSCKSSSYLRLNLVNALRLERLFPRKIQ
jgi:hypothetical protein